MEKKDTETVIKIQYHFVVINLLTSILMVKFNYGWVQAAEPTISNVKIVNVEVSDIGPNETRHRYPMLINNGKGFRIKCLSQNDEEGVVRGLGFLSLPSVTMDPLSNEIVNSHPNEQPFLCPYSTNYKIKLFRFNPGTGEQFYMLFPIDFNDGRYGENLYIAGCSQLLSSLKLSSSQAIFGDPTPFYQDRIYKIDCLTIKPELKPEYNYVATLTGHSNEVNSVRFSPDGSKVVSGSRDSTIKIWDVARGKEIKTLTGHTGPVNSVAFGPDGSKILSGSQDSTIKIWDMAGGTNMKTLAPAGFVHSVNFSPDGSKIVSGSSIMKFGTGPTRNIYYMGATKIWDAVSGNEIRTLTDDSSAPVSSVNYSNDGGKIVSGSGEAGTPSGGKITIWDVASGTEMRTITVHPTGSVFTVNFSPDGKKIVCGSYPGNTIKIWDVASGGEIKTLTGHSSPVTSVNFSPDGSKIVSGSDRDKNIKIWDVASGREIKTLTGHIDGIKSVYFSPDGRKIVSGSVDGTVKIWGDQL